MTNVRFWDIYIDPRVTAFGGKPLSYYSYRALAVGGGSLLPGRPAQSFREISRSKNEVKHSTRAVDDALG
jgi:hypothetical protein